MEILYAGSCWFCHYTGIPRFSIIRRSKALFSAAAFSSAQSVSRNLVFRFGQKEFLLQVKPDRGGILSVSPAGLTAARQTDDQNETGFDC